MRWLCTSRIARLAAAILSVVTISGCPELNYWQGPSQDPFFSVVDPLAVQPVTDTRTSQSPPKPILQTAVSSPAF